MFNDEFKQVRYYYKHALTAKTQLANKLRFTIINVQLQLLHNQLFIQSIFHHHL